MHRERAETHLRLLAEAELRLSMSPLPGAKVNRHTPSLALAAQVLCTVGAVGIGAMDEIQHDFHFARAVRQPGPARPTARWRTERFTPFLPPARTAAVVPPSPPWRVVPIGQVLRIPDDRARGELYLLAYVQSMGGARFTVTGWIDGSPGSRGPGPAPAAPPRRIRHQYIAVDDQGSRHHLDFSARSGPGRTEWQGVLELQPEPPRQIRWLDVTTIPGDPATRIDLEPKDPENSQHPQNSPDLTPDITVTKRTVSPGELLLAVVAARLSRSRRPFRRSPPSSWLPPGRAWSRMPPPGSATSSRRCRRRARCPSPVPFPASSPGCAPAWVSAATALSRRPPRTCPDRG